MRTARLVEFQTPMYLPAGKDQAARRKLETAGREKILRDMQAQGFTLVPQSLQVCWTSDLQGTIRAKGVKG